MEAILKFDTALFLLLNTRLTSPALDVVMQFATDKSNFLHVALLGAAVMVLKDGRRGVRGLMLLVIAVVVSDLAANILKNAFGRVRPCHEFQAVRLLAGCSASYSLPSGHAANIFAIMVFLSARYKRWMIAFLAIAVAVSYSRVYVGVHYPLDVIGGAAAGSSVALLFATADRAVVQPVMDYIKGKRAWLF